MRITSDEPSDEIPSDESRDDEISSDESRDSSEKKLFAKLAVALVVCLHFFRPMNPHWNSMIGCVRAFGALCDLKYNLSVSVVF